MEMEKRDSTDPREVVIRRLCAELGRWPDLRFNPLETTDLTSRDARLAHALYSETMRRLVTLEYLLNQALRRPLDEIEVKLRACLLVGACQIFFFDHLPDHAVVDETVKWAGRFVRVKAKGLANAVLRKMIELRGECVEPTEAWEDRFNDQTGLIPLCDGRWLELRENVLPEKLSARLSVQTSHPAALVDRWLKNTKRHEVMRFLLHNLTPAPIIITGKWEKENGDGGWEGEDHEEAGFTVWTGDRHGLVDFLERNKGARVQDPGSAALCSATSCLDLAGKMIVDVCAGSGTKTEQLSYLHPESTIIATDVSDRRRSLLQTRFTDHDRVKVVEPSELPDYAGRAALVVLDVPCSNTGVLARRIEAKYRVDPVHLKSLTDLQKQIIADSLYYRDDAGHILYSTCSIEPIENERQSAWVEKWHKLRVISQGSQLPKGLPHEKSSRYRDGGYHVLLGCL